MAEIKNGMEFIRSLEPKEKAEMFEKIAENFYASNFGTFSKSQIDLLMFSLFIEKLIDKGMNYDDYTMSKQLGILQSNVRQMKKKKQLVYPKGYEWYKPFLNDVKTASFDGDKVVINISDPNVYLELQHAIEELGGYTEVQLNPKLLKIPPGYIIELIIKIHGEEKKLSDNEIKKLRAELVSKLNKQFLEDGKLEDQITAENLRTKLKKKGLELGLEILKSMIPGEKIGESIFHLAKSIFKQN